MKIKLLALLLLPFTCLAQKGGIHFEEGLTWDQVKAKALTEHKYILVDCYTTWCGPCKFMKEQIFTLEDIGRTVDSNFISITLQMDSTSSDDATIRQGYTQANLFARKYHIDVFPTFLFFAPDGTIVHKATGASVDSKSFLRKAEEALDPDKQYYTLSEHYKEHAGDSLFLRKTIIAALAASENQQAGTITDLYIDCLKNPFLKENLQLIQHSTRSVNSKGFRLFLQHQTEVDTSLGLNSANQFLVDIITREKINPLLAGNAALVDWNLLYKQLRAQYPLQAEELVIRAKPAYYFSRKLFELYGKALVEYMNRYGGDLPTADLNDKAWYVFLYCKDPAVLRQALTWSRRTFTGNILAEDNPIDTYANLLYKAGDKKAAILWESKAASMAHMRAVLTKVEKYLSLRDKYLKTIDRMEKGENIWDHPLELE